MVEPSQSCRYLPLTYKTLAVVTISTVTFLVLRLLAAYEPSLINAANCVGALLGGIISIYFISYCVAQMRHEKKEPISDHEPAKDPSLQATPSVQPCTDETNHKTFVVDAIATVPSSEEQKQYVQLSSKAMASLFSEDQKEKRVAIGNRVYLAVENKALSPTSIALNKNQIDELNEFLGIDTAKAAFVIAAVDTTEVFEAHFIQFTFSMRDKALLKNNICILKKDFLNRKLDELWRNEVFAVKQRMILSFDGVEFEVSVVALYFSSQFFRIGSNTRVKFELEEDICDEKDIASTSDVTLCFTTTEVDFKERELKEFDLQCALITKLSFSDKDSIGKDVFLVKKPYVLKRGQVITGNQYQNDYLLSRISSFTQENQEYSYAKLKGETHIKIFTLLEEADRLLKKYAKRPNTDLIT